MRARRAAFAEQHVDDLLRRSIAEQLPARFFVKSDVVLFDECDEVLLRIAFQRRDTKTRIVRQEICRRRMDVGEVAAPATGDANFLSRHARLFEHDDGAPALTGDGRAHQARRPRAEDDDVGCCVGGGRQVRKLFWRAEAFSSLIQTLSHDLPSSSAKADDPVFREVHDFAETLRRTGSPPSRG